MPSIKLKGGPLELLFERAGLPACALPEALAKNYPGSFGFQRPRLFANFVASVDGTVALQGVGESGHVVSGDNEADRFVMGMLRAYADAVLIGAGTFRASPQHRWHADQIFPSAAAPLAELRQQRGLNAHPKLVLITGSGNIDARAPALSDAWIVTTSIGAAKLRGALPATARLVVLDPSPMRLAPLIELLHSEGFELLLTEGGPSLVGQLVAEGLLDELFLTLSPRLFGQSPGDGRKNLIQGVDVTGTSLELLSAQRSESHLLLRYALGGR
jgi:riboflavin biosynthesis pyrimidine reductase